MRRTTLEARRERNIRERANRPYFKRVLDEMQNFATSGYQADQTAFQSIYLRPRTRHNEYSVLPGLSAFASDFFPSRSISIITRLRIWVRKAMKRRNLWSAHYDSYYGGMSRNLVGRSGWEVMDVAGHVGNMPSYMGYGIPPNPRVVRIPNRSRGPNPRVPQWSKNQRVRLF